jgi:hypothetical protein
MKIYSLTLEDMTRSANNAVMATANTMLSSGVIDEETYKIMTEDFAIVVGERNFFGKCVAKALGRDEDDKGIFYNCVQVNNINYNKDKKDVHQPEDSDTRRVDHGSI